MTAPSKPRSDIPARIMITLSVVMLVTSTALAVAWIALGLAAKALVPH